MKEQYSHRLLIKHIPATHIKTLHIQPHLQLAAPRGKQSASPTNRQSTTFIIAWILRCGVILSATITLVGLLLLLVHSGGVTSQNVQFFPHTMGQVWIGLLALQPQAIIALRLLLLIATPVASVTASIVGFALEHDHCYVVIALIVLLTLITSFLLGKVG